MSCSLTLSINRQIKIPDLPIVSEDFVQMVLVHIFSEPLDDNLSMGTRSVGGSSSSHMIISR